MHFVLKSKLKEDKNADHFNNICLLMSVYLEKQLMISSTSVYLLL